MNNTVSHNPLPAKRPVALVLQGGGALGAYQAGVYQALHENALAPDWVVGTSIGAINAAIIAGNPAEQRVARLKEFWNRVSHPDPVDMHYIPDNARKWQIGVSTADSIWRGVPGFFTPRSNSLFPFGMAVKPEAASFYKTEALAETLHELVDFDYLNAADGMRLTVNALKVTTGELASFDNIQHTLEVSHILASGALPPGFPGVRIDGELYWDGGLYSNTPLETVLGDTPEQDILCFMVDLWNAHGDEPTTFDEVQTRQKDVMFASRSKRHIEAYLKQYKLQRALYQMYKKIPPEQRTAEETAMVSEFGCDTTIHIVRLPYGGQDWHMASKDVNFSRGSLEWRWEQGYKHATTAIQQAGWHNLVSEGTGVVVHELPHESAKVQA